MTSGVPGVRLGCGRMEGCSWVPAIGVQGRHCAGMTGMCSVGRVNVFSLVAGGECSFQPNVFTLAGQVFGGDRGPGWTGGSRDPPFDKLRASSSAGSGQVLRGRRDDGGVFRARCVQFLAECVQFRGECVHFGGRCVQFSAGRLGWGWGCGGSGCCCRTGWRGCGGFCGIRGMGACGESRCQGLIRGFGSYAVPRAAGALADFRTADRRGQSRDQGAVLLAVRPVWGGASTGAKAVDSVPDYVD